jgi:hypothetical protein
VSGFVFSKGGCKKAKADVAHLCAVGDAADCKTQCEKGSSGSCDRLGSILSRRDPNAALSAFDKACTAGFPNACANLGIGLLYGSSRDPERAVKALQLGCLTGSPRACEAAGEVWLEGLAGGKDAAKALRYFARGCEGGDYTACTNAGFMYSGGGGAGVARDDQKAIDYGQRACFGGVPMACGNIGYKVELGEGVAANPTVAFKLYERACKLSTSECFRAGFLFETGASGIPHDDGKAKTLLDLSCKAGGGLSGLACVVGNTLYGSPVTGLSKSTLADIGSKMKGQCDAKDGRACTFLGISEYGLGHKPEAQRALKQGCSFRDTLGCDLAKKLK